MVRSGSRLTRFEPSRLLASVWLRSTRGAKTRSWKSRATRAAKASASSSALGLTSVQVSTAPPLSTKQARPGSTWTRRPQSVTSKRALPPMRSASSPAPSAISMRTGTDQPRRRNTPGSAWNASP